ncbi:MAG: Plug domain-containing protein [Longimicrobiales bacterium]
MSVHAGRRSARSWGGILLAVLAVLVAAPVQSAAQVAGGAALPADTTAVPDSTSIDAEVEDQATDTVSADTIYYNLPALDPASRAGPVQGFVTGVWEWDRLEIMASGANTLAELFAEVPGLIVLLGGDYGTPAAVTAFGTGGGGVRIVRDGFEVLPLEGGVADLQRVGLGGIERVRLERGAGELQVELTSFRFVEGRSFSLIEAGTGQLDTNMFRGMYADPTAFRGSLALALERVDTRGYGQNEGGNRTGTWFRYALHRGNRAGIAFEHRRMGSDTQVTNYAASVSRTDWTVRARLEVVPGLETELYTGRSSHDVDDVRPAYDFEGGSVAQHGARVAATRGGFWARAEGRLFPDDELLVRRLDGAAGLVTDRVGLSAYLARSSWQSESVLSYRGSAWLTPLPAVTLFASWDGGTYAARSGPLLDELPAPTPPLAWPTPPVGPTYATTERTALRLGGAVTLAGATLAAAALRTDSDLHLPLGLELDRGGGAVAGRERNGLEAWGSLPTPWRSLRLEGSYQMWDEAGPYLPKQSYRGAFVFRKTYLETGNFELWWTLGVRGYDPMDVFSTTGGLAPVPFYQSWYGRVQARILTVRLFLGWENFTIRRNLQNFPGRTLPLTRSFFGLHWDLWN